MTGFLQGTYQALVDQGSLLNRRGPPGAAGDDVGAGGTGRDRQFVPGNRGLRPIQNLGDVQGRQPRMPHRTENDDDGANRARTSVDSENSPRMGRCPSRPRLSATMLTASLAAALVSRTTTPATSGS